MLANQLCLRNLRVHVNGLEIQLYDSSFGRLYGAVLNQLRRLAQNFLRVFDLRSGMCMREEVSVCVINAVNPCFARYTDSGALSGTEQIWSCRAD